MHAQTISAEDQGPSSLPGFSLEQRGRKLMPLVLNN
jgi:hypothetical protein